MSKTRTVEEIIRPIADDRALVERAAELMRNDGFWHDIDHMHKGWQEERDQWLRDAGMEK